MGLVGYKEVPTYSNPMPDQPWWTVSFEQKVTRILWGADDIHKVAMVQLWDDPTTNIWVGAFGTYLSM